LFVSEGGEWMQSVNMKTEQCIKFLNFIFALCLKNLYIPVKRAKKFCYYILGSDIDFYEEFAIHLSDEEQEKFFDDNPDFMSKFPVGHNKIYLLKDWRFRGILRKIKKCEGGRDETT